MGLNGIGQFLNVIQKAVSRNVKLSSDVENAGDLAGIFYMVQNLLPLLSVVSLPMQITICLRHK